MKLAKTISLISLLSRFPDEASVVAAFEKWRWGDTPECPRCGQSKTHPRPWRHGHWCCGCRKCFTVRTGMVFENSRLPLRQWLLAMYLMLTARKGIPATQLKEKLGVTYRTAWFLGHRLREACAETGELLSGLVEVDETYIGGLERNRKKSKKRKAGRGTAGKAVVLGMRQRGGRTVAMTVPDASGATLWSQIAARIAIGSTVITDEWGGYKDVGGAYYKHKVINKYSTKKFVEGVTHTNGIESIWAVLKRGYKGTYHSWSVKHLGRYVNEFAFRLNDGNGQVDIIDRIADLVQGANGKRLTYKALTA